MSLKPLTAEPFGKIPAGTRQSDVSKQLITLTGTPLWHFALPKERLLHIAMSVKGLSHESQRVQAGEIYLKPNEKRI